MSKYCVFCGEKPKSKNNEHVIPQWLIELTGNPKRTGIFGYEKWLNPDSKPRSFSFDSFKFPSCASCNQKYSVLEESAKSVVSKILSEDSISSIEFNTLLDWFDKVRIGLWLGQLYLSKNPLGITPKFHITKRIGLNDRMLAIFRTDEKKKWLHFFGTGSPSFNLTPSCFALSINHFMFLNISCDYLFSRRIGFPYPTSSSLVENKDISDEPIMACRLVKGRSRVMAPLLKKRIRISTTEIYQPMYPLGINNPEIKELYETDYVLANSISHENGVGKILIQDINSIKEYPEIHSKSWLPKHHYSVHYLITEMQILVTEWQAYIDDLAPSLKLLSKERRAHIIKMKQLSKEFNYNLINRLRSKKP